MARLKRKKDKVREAAYGRHSPAGYRYLKRKRKKEAEQKGFSGRTKRELGYLSDADYKAVMEAMRKR